MTKLIIKNFSCLRSAELEFSRLTVIIGPQASGKSVICKLAYFFADVATDQNSFVTRAESFDRFQKHISEKFKEWFPPDAWGPNQFKIDYECGKFKICLTRKIYKGKVKPEFKVSISRDFCEQYNSLLEISEKFGRPGNILPDNFEYEWKIREESQKSLGNIMGSDFYNQQIFIPAGRSFFTSLDKAITIFEQARSIDPLILRFGRLYNSLREHYYFYGESQERELRELIKSNLEKLFGGVVKKEAGVEFLLAEDGRKIRLTSLSSGQQELFPLLTTIPYITSRNSNTLCYIEEPEAHLFPASQSALIASLIMLLSAAGAKKSNGLVFTTHSPYVLSKINNLIKAGAIGRRSKEAALKRVEALVPRRSWLNGRYVRAYCIEDGVLSSIMDDDNLINAEYLDGISDDISNEFSDLLDLENSL